MRWNGVSPNILPVFLNISHLHKNRCILTAYSCVSAKQTKQTSTGKSYVGIRKYYNHFSTIVFYEHIKSSSFRSTLTRNLNPKSGGNSFRPKGQIITFESYLLLELTMTFCTGVVVVYTCPSYYVIETSL